MTAQTNTLDYQECMQNAALAFLERHQAEHLGDLSALLNRAINHLVATFDVSESVAIKLTSLAHLELQGVAYRQRLDLDYSNTTVVVIKDPIKGVCWSVPVSLIYERILTAPDNVRLRSANS
ncbi:hypothetical protein DJ028_18940 [Pseudomonas veronii]|uniref:hypothetical protein n=1 Tax=Pseudomonas veronii TaxID=76761 RepID=UPI000FE2E21F|nr:hypothetical protein [Pseudomonas veronii]RWA26163.1 hypothetical protein DJ028_18940 [Pseudomonas veronii]